MVNINIDNLNYNKISKKTVSKIKELLKDNTKFINEFDNEILSYINSDKKTKGIMLLLFPVISTIYYFIIMITLYIIYNYKKGKIIIYVLSVLYILICLIFGFYLTIKYKDYKFVSPF